MRATTPRPTGNLSFDLCTQLRHGISNCFSAKYFFNFLPGAELIFTVDNKLSICILGRLLSTNYIVYSTRPLEVDYS